MKVAFMAPANVVHTQRWVTSLAERGVDLLLLTQHAPTDWTVPSGVRLHVLPFAGSKGYFLNAPAARRVLREYCPDLVNCHYASGYGTLASLCGRHPSLLSVWGSDVYDFPYQSALAFRIVRHNLRNADRIASTSKVMAEQVRRLVPEIADIDITPFGVESDRFAPMKRSSSTNLLTIGTVKTLADKYGIDTLIDAFAALLLESGGLTSSVRDRLRLLLVGEGPERAALEARVEVLGIRDRVTFSGRIPHQEVPVWLNRLDIYVAASRLDSESFGVAIIEASSCELPVVVSDAGGLPEVVRDGETGLVVPRNDPVALCAALRRLVNDAPLRFSMGRAGRKLVQCEYEWERCVDHMLECYEALVCS